MIKYLKKIKQLDKIKDTKSIKDISKMILKNQKNYTSISLRNIFLFRTKPILKKKDLLEITKIIQNSHLILIMNIKDTTLKIAIEMINIQKDQI